MNFNNLNIVNNTISFDSTEYNERNQFIGNLIDLNISSDDSEFIFSDDDSELTSSDGEYYYSEYYYGYSEDDTDDEYPDCYDENDGEFNEVNINNEFNFNNNANIDNFIRGRITRVISYGNLDLFR